MRWVWILDRRRDLVFYIGSALAGWLYVALVAYAITRFDDPFAGSLFTLRFGETTVPFTLEILVVASWAFLLDAPHLWATLGRTFFDPDEWRVRRRELLFSFVWFGVGPLMVLAPYAVGAIGGRLGRPLPVPLLASGAIVFFILFRIWAYYHVVRQHWGFFSLYKRKAGDFDHHRLDTLFFNVTMWAPLVLFITSSYYLLTPGYSDLGLHRPLVAGRSLAEVVHPLAWLVYATAILAYLAFLGRRWAGGETLNGSKLAYLALLVPLHLVAFSHPVMAVFLVPLVTVGHNLQYHCIVYSYAGNKYRSNAEPRYRWARFLFKNVAIYGAFGLLYTFLLFRGPWIDWLRSATGVELDRVLFDSLGMMAGIRDPSALGLGEQVFAAMILGWAMQHYYLDSKIWRVSKDKDVQKNLKV